MPFTVPFTYNTFYYSGAGPYHEYDTNLNQQALLLYPDLTPSMHFEEYGFAATMGVTGALQLYLGGSAASPTTTSYYFLSINAEIDFFQIVPYKQIFFFTRLYDINEPAAQGPDMGPDDQDDEGSSGMDDTEDDGDNEDDGGMEDDGSEEDDRLREDSEWDETDDESVFLLGDGSGSGDDSGSGSNGEDDQPQGFHMYLGAAYDLEFGNAYISYCEGAWTGGASIWTIGTSAWTNWSPPGAQQQMRTDCWFDPELTVSIDMLVPPSLHKMLG